jgi:hypothetical protein
MAQIKKKKDKFRVAVPGQAGEFPPIANDHGERFIPKKGNKEKNHMETKDKKYRSIKKTVGRTISKPSGKKSNSSKRRSS